MTEQEGSNAADPPVGARDDIEHKYQEARREGETLAAMMLARQIAEAVAAAMVSRVPSTARAAFSSRDLQARLGILEQHAEAIGIPRFVVAALRTLQAYGNCATHYQKGELRPPKRATASVMASLAHVTQWFLRQDEAADERKLELTLREPSPPRPGFAERRRLVQLIPSSLPTTAGDPSRTGVLNRADPRSVQLATLLQFHARELDIVQGISRAVLERETEENVAGASPDTIVDMIDALCDARPAVVPRTVAQQVRDVVRRERAVRRAIDEGDEGLDALIAEATRTGAVRDLVHWFDETYVGRSAVERHGLRWLFLAALALLAFRVASDSCARDGARALRARLLREHCAGELNLEAAEICADLRSEDAADQARRSAQ